MSAFPEALSGFYGPQGRKQYSNFIMVKINTVYGGQRGNPCLFLQEKRNPTVLFPWD